MTRYVWKLFVFDMTVCKKNSLKQLHKKCKYQYTMNAIPELLHVSSKVGARSQEQSEGSLFNSYFTLICTLYCWLLSKEVSSNILKVFGMTWPGIEPRPPRTLANTLPTRPMSYTKFRFYNRYFQNLVRMVCKVDIFLYKNV